MQIGIGQDEKKLGAAVFLFVVIAAFFLCHVFSGRAAYIHFGAMLGSIMVANVFFVIIPGQRELVEATKEGRTPDPTPGLNAKQRSVHNTYFTLPELFVMISNHYALTYGHNYNWLILIAISLAGALIRVYCVALHFGRFAPIPAGVALLLLADVVAVILPKPADPASASTGTAAETFAKVQSVVQQRCTSCHAASPTQPGFAAAPKGVAFDTPKEIVNQAQQIHQQAVVTKAMPIGNLTQITEDERALIERWFQGGAKRQ